MKKLLVCLLILCVLVTHSTNQLVPKEEVLHDRPQLELSWYDKPQNIKNYVKQAYGSMSELILWVMHKESSFNTQARNGNFVGLMQVGPAACRAVQISYRDATAYPWINIEAGARYLKKYCVPMGNNDREEIYRRYMLGPWYDKQSKESP